MFLSGQWSDRGGLNKMISVVSSLISSDYEVFVCSLDICPPSLGYVLDQKVKYVEFPPHELVNIHNIVSGMGIDLLVVSNNCDIPYLDIYKKLEKTNIKTIMWNHEFFFLPYAQENLLEALSYRDNIFQYPNAIIWPTKTSAMLCEQYSDKVVTIGNCIIESELQKNIKKYRASQIRLVSIGRFDSRQKGIGDLLLMFSELLNIHKDSFLSIVGKYDFDLQYSENSQETVGQLLGRLNIPSDKIKFNGEIQGVERIIAESFVNVITSDAEGFGLTILESANQAIPSIVFSGGGPSDIIENGVNGVVVQFGDYQEMANQIFRLFKSSNDYQLMKINTSSIVGRHSIVKIKNKWIKLIDTLFNDGKLQKKESLNSRELEIIKLYNHYSLRIANRLVKYHSLGNTSPQKEPGIHLRFINKKLQSLFKR